MRESRSTAPAASIETERRPELPPEPTLNLDADGRLAQDLSCRHCGYNLRGLGAAERCPECETPIGRSIHGDLLRYCDPGWVVRLANGMRLWVLSIIAGLVFGVLAAVLLVVVVVGAGGGTGTAALVLVVAGFVALTAVKLYAIWQITTPDPGHDEGEHPWSLRALARWGLLVSGLATGAMAAYETRGGLAGLTGPASAAVGAGHFFLALAAAAVGLGAMACLFLYAQSLARRLPDEPLARSTRTVMWGYLISTGAIQALDLVRKSVPSLGVNPGAALGFGLLSILVLIACLVYWIWGFVLVFRYRNHLMASAALARKTWAEPV